jgi:hypothetical protein
VPTRPSAKTTEPRAELSTIDGASNRQADGLANAEDEALDPAMDTLRWMEQFVVD